MTPPFAQAYYRLDSSNIIGGLSFDLFKTCDYDVSYLHGSRRFQWTCDQI